MKIEDRGLQMQSVAGLFLTTTSIACLLRCFVRIKIVKAFGLDDWMMMGAWAWFVAYGVSSIIAIRHGAGRHHADLAPADIEIARKHWYLCYPFYAITMTLSKLSIGYFLLRITAVPSHKYIIYTASAVTVLTAVTMFFLTLFECSPVQYYWTKYNGGTGTCIDAKIVVILAYLYSATNVLVDLAFAVLPCVMVWRTQLRTRVKLLLGPLLAMGCIASLAVVVRMVYLGRLSNHDDFMWVTVDIAIWSTVEAGLAITAGSLATLKPLLPFVSKRLAWGSRSGGNVGGTTPNQSRTPPRKDPLDNSGRRKPSRVGIGLFSVRGRSDLESSSGDDEFQLVSKTKYDVPYAPKGTYQQSSTVVSKPGPPSAEDVSTMEANESRENLKAEGRPSRGSLEQRQHGVVITKSWFVGEDRAADRRNT